MTCVLALLISGLPLENDVIARVDGAPITFGDLVREVLSPHGRQALEELIHRKKVEAIETEMKKAGVEVSEEELLSEFERDRALFAQQHGPEASFDEFLRGKKMGPEGYGARVRLRLLAMKVLRPGLEGVADADLAICFARHEDRYAVPERRRVSHILICPVDPESRRPRPEEEISRLVGRVAEELRSGKDFARVARRLSDDKTTRARGGDLGWMNSRGEGSLFGQALREAVFWLAEGQSGGPVQSTFGQHFIKVTDVVPGRKRTFEEVREKVREDYVREELFVRCQKWADELLARARVERLYELEPER